MSWSPHENRIWHQLVKPHNISQWPVCWIEVGQIWFPSWGLSISLTGQLGRGGTMSLTGWLDWGETLCISFLLSLWGTYIPYWLASPLMMGKPKWPATPFGTGYRLVLGGPSKMGNCHISCLVYNGGNSLKCVMRGHIFSKIKCMKSHGNDLTNSRQLMWWSNGGSQRPWLKPIASHTTTVRALAICLSEST